MFLSIKSCNFPYFWCIFCWQQCFVYFSYKLEEVSDEFCQTQDENENNNGSNGIPVIQNLQEFLKCPFRWPESVSDVEFDEILL